MASGLWTSMSFNAASSASRFECKSEMKAINETLAAPTRHFRRAWGPDIVEAPRQGRNRHLP